MTLNLPYCAKTIIKVGAFASSLLLLACAQPNDNSSEQQEVTEYKQWIK